MTDNSNRGKPPLNIEEQLAQILQSSQPDPDFTKRLEAELTRQAERLASGFSPAREPKVTNAPRLGWISGLAGLAFLAIIIIAIINLLPQSSQVADPITGTQDLSTLEATQTVERNPVYPAAVPSFTPRIPSPTPAVTQVSSALVKVGRVWLRAGPGVQYAVVSEILAGTRLPLLGSSPDGEWVQVSYPPAPQGTAWIYSKLITQIQDDIPNNTPADATAALQVSATNARRESDRLYIDVCFELPDNRDWTIFDALLEYGSEGMWREVPPAESILLSITEPPAADSSGQRCDTLEFHLFSEKYITNPRLDILSVVAEPREGGSCALYLNEVQSRLDAQNSGIRIACEEAPHSLGQAAVVQWPEGMSQQEAQWIVQKAYRDMNTVKGPWIFPLDETQLAPPQRESGDSPPLAGLLELHDLRVSNFPMPGWLHLLTRHFEREINGATSAVDGPATEYQLDAWYYLDEQGQLAQAVERRSVNEGQASQVRVLQDALWHDLNTNEVTPHDPAASFHLDFGFLADAAYAVKTGKRLTRQPAYAEGIYLGDQYVLEDETCIKKALFDPYSGQLLSLYVYTVNPGASGPPEETDLLSSVVVLSIETPAEAPDEVLAYFLK